MITIIPIEPISDEHHDKIIAAFNRFFLCKGGQQDGWSHGYGDMDGDGFYDSISDKCPEAWQVE